MIIAKTCDLPFLENIYLETSMKSCKQVSRVIVLPLYLN